MCILHGVTCIHRNRYWLWYTTKRCVGGVVRRVYQRLKQFKVQFLVLQRKSDPSQVLLQCLPANKVCTFFFSCTRHQRSSKTTVCSLLFLSLDPVLVKRILRWAWTISCLHTFQTVIVWLFSVQVDGTVRSLSEQYDGPQPSDLCDLLEGEQFFAGFERGLDINTGRNG